jgi:hypothetical protein
MSKADDRAALERLVASFKDETKICPPKAQTNPVKKSKLKRAAPDGRLEAAETAMRTVAAPVVEATNAARDGSGADLGGSTRFKEADYDLSEGPRNHAHRAWKMPKDESSRAYIEMMIEAADDDDDDDDHSYRSDHEEREREKRFRSAGKTGTNCGACGKLLAPDDPVWRIRRKYDGRKVDLKFGHRVIYETESVVAPVCRPCWDQRNRVALSDPCKACGRSVHVTAKALKSWLEHGKTTYCCEDCARGRKAEPPAFTKVCVVCGSPFTPKRLDARMCGAACRAKKSRKNNPA